MRQALFAVFISIFLSFAWAGDCEKSVEKYLDAGEIYTYAGVDGGAYLLFSINGKYSMIAKCSENRYLTDAGEIEPVLLSYANSSGNAGKPAIDAAWQKRMNGLLDSFSSSRAKESVCMMYTGIDKFPCSTRDECFKSCYTPMCMDMKYGSKCELKNPVCEFVDGITDFSNNITYLDKGTAKIRALVAGISNVSGQGQIEGGISVLDGMVRACGAINQNPLLRTIEEKGYYFCPKVAYDLGSLSGLKSELVDLKNKYSLFIQPNTEAESISKESQRRIQVRRSLDACSQSVNYSSSALAGIMGSNHPATNYSEVREKTAKMGVDADLIASLCRDRKFSEAEGAISTFKNDEAAAMAALANVSAEYDSVRQLYDKVFNEVSSIPPEKNASAVLESMRMVQRELGTVQNVSDLAVLRGVLLENERKAQELAKPAPWSVDLNAAALALAGALIITAALYFMMKRTRRRGL